MVTRTCPGCKTVFPYQEGLESSGGLFRYGVNSPECNAAFGQLLTHEYEQGCFNKHSPQAYAVQHPPHLVVQRERGIEDRFIAASRQSVAIHLVWLYLMLETDLAPLVAGAAVQRVLASGVKLEDEYAKLTVPESLGDITVVDVLKACNDQEHWQLLDAWNRSAWKAWEKDHGLVREWYQKYGHKS